MTSDIQSLETNSTSVVEDSLNITFEDIKYTVRTGILNSSRKTILNDLSGTFNAGELTVIMGQSGAGKSSLMDILTGYTKPTSGKIFVNGQLRNERVFRRSSCYIMQDDKLHDMLTIQESLTIAADLKLGNHISIDQKQKRVDEIITALGLGRVRHTKSGRLSGGEKKRLAVGLELVNDPAVMFIDEPTSGLDSSMCKQVVYLLRLLARQGRTVIVTMHQASAPLLRLVDRLYVVLGGRCAYAGAVPQLLPFLKQMDLICSPYHNPVDFLIEISADNADKLVAHTQNGKCVEWLPNIPHETDEQLLELYNRSTFKETYLTSLPTVKENPTNKLLLKIKSTYATPSWKQSYTLTRRSLLCLGRDPTFALMITGIHCSIGLFIGFLYYNIGGDAKYIMDNFRYLYFSLMFLMFTAFSAVTITFPEQISVVRREHFNRWYTVGAYFTSILMSTVPTQTICTLLYAIITYWLTGQPAELKRFCGFCSVLLMVSYVAVLFGLLNGSLFNVKYGSVFGPFFIMPFTIFSGFFLRYIDAPQFFRWIFHVSFLKHGLVGLVISVFGMERPKLPCSAEVMCYYRHPKQFLIDNDMQSEKFSLVVIALSAILVVLITLTYIILKIRLRHKW